MILETAKIDAMIDKYGRDASSLILVLQDIQALYRYLPREALQYLSEQLNAPLAKIYNVATFFKAFSLKPKGEHVVCVCMGTACHVRGAPRILDDISRQLDLEPNATSKDEKFTLETVNCLGSCALGPLVVVDDQYIGHATATKMKQILGPLAKAKG